MAAATGPPRREQAGPRPPRWAGAGRWVELDLLPGPTQRSALPDLPGPLTVVSAYVPTGEAGTAKQEDKQAFLDAVLIN